jgi:hypothetical protein
MSNHDPIPEPLHTERVVIDGREFVKTVLPSAPRPRQLAFTGSRSRFSRLNPDGHVAQTRSSAPTN